MRVWKLCISTHHCDCDGNWGRKLFQWEELCYKRKERLIPDQVGVLALIYQFKPQAITGKPCRRKSLSLAAFAGSSSPTTSEFWRAGSPATLLLSRPRRGPSTSPRSCQGKRFSPEVCHRSCQGVQPEPDVAEFCLHEENCCCLSLLPWRKAYIAVVKSRGEVCVSLAASESWSLAFAQRHCWESCYIP